MRKLFILLIFTSLFTVLSCKQEENSIPIETNSDSKTDFTESENLTENQIQMKNYYESKGLFFDKEKSIEQFQYEKRILENKIFKDNNFCELYYTYLKLSGSDLKNFLKKYEIKGESIDNFLAFNGAGLCENYIKDKVLEKNHKKIDYTLPDVDARGISIDFIKDDLYNPESLEYSSFDCKQEQDGNKYTILRKIKASNKLGVESEFVYKLILMYQGGNENDKSSWKLISIKSEEYR